MSEPEYYPENPCYLAPLRPGIPAPKPGCHCDVCKFFNTGKQAVKWIPVIQSREPFIGILERKA